MRNVVKRRSLGLPSSKSERKLVVALCATTFLLWIGGSSILPLLPSYLRQHGSTPGLIGLVMASYFAASVMTQFPAGRVSDRIGRRPVLVAGLVLFALGSIGFALTSGAGFAIVSRALQGVGAGAVTVASAATIGSVVAVSERGGSFGALYGSQMAALAVGPLVGSLIGATSMRLLFVIGAASAFAAVVPVASFIPSRRPQGVTLRVPARDGVRVEELEALSGGAPGGLGLAGAPRGLRLSPAVVGVVFAFVATGGLVGVYEACWTLLLRLRGATTFDVGLSWTLFALPFAVLSLPAGRLADRFDRRVLALGGLIASAAFCSAYPFIHLVPLLVALGVAGGGVFGRRRASRGADPHGGDRGGNAGPSSRRDRDRTHRGDRGIRRRGRHPVRRRPRHPVCAGRVLCRRRLRLRRVAVAGRRGQVGNSDGGGGASRAPIGRHGRRRNAPEPVSNPPVAGW